MGDTPQPHRSAETLGVEWNARGIAADSLRVGSRATVGLDAPEPSTEEVQTPYRAESVDDDLLFGKRIAEGGMGFIYQAADLTIGRHVAVKILRAPDTAKGRRGLETEARAAGALQHPGIVPVYWLSRDSEGAPQIVMPLLRGATWAERMDAGASLEDGLWVLERVADAVGYAHAKGVVHRDLKPENVHVGEHGDVRVLDWGLAVRVSGSGASGDRAVDELPVAAAIASVAGTIPYMAPEMAAASGRDIAEPTDVYLLGAILFELLTGAPPHALLPGESDEPVAWLTRVYENDIVGLEGAPRQLAQVCLKALSTDPLDRYSSGQEFAEALRAIRHRADTVESLHVARRALETSRVLSGSDARREAAYAVATLEALLDAEPHNEETLALMEEAHRRRFVLAMESGHVQAARSAFEFLLEPSDEDAARLAQLELQQRAEDNERSRMADAVANQDLTRGAFRRRLATALAIAWIAVGFGAGLLERRWGISLGAVEYVGALTAAALAVGVPLVLTRDRTMPNAANKRLYRSLVWMLLGHGATFLALHRLGLDYPHATAAVMLQFAFTVGVRAVYVHRALLAMIPVLLLACGGCIAAPSYWRELGILAYAAYFLLGAYRVDVAETLTVARGSGGQR